MCDLQDDVSALHEALAVDDAVDEDAGDLYAALLQPHGQTLQGKTRNKGCSCKVIFQRRHNIFFLTKELHAVWFIRNTVKLRLDLVFLCVSHFLNVKLDKK